MQQCRRGHYTAYKCDLLQAIHWYNTIVQVQQGKIVGPTAQYISILATNLQKQNQANVAIYPTTGASL